MKRFINNFIENFRIFIYDTEKYYRKIDGIFSFLVFWLLCSIIIYYNSFFLDDYTLRLYSYVNEIFLLFYFLRFLLRVIYNINEKESIFRKYFWDCIFFFTTSVVLFFLNLKNIWEYFSKVVLFIYLIIDLSKFFSNYVTKIKISNQSILILSFIFLIFFGSILLTMPKMTLDGKGLDFLVALFSATSASCVTGLSVVDITQVLSLKGQLVLLGLIQLGGLNMIIFASFFVILDGHNSKYQNMLKENLNTNSILDNKAMIRNIFFITIIFEGIGTSLLYLSIPRNYFYSDIEALFHSIFHSVSAFNNAGFSSFDYDFSINYFRRLYFFQIIIMALIVVGGIGFPVIKECTSLGIFKKGFLKKVSITTRIVIKMTIALIFIGTVLFFVLEYNNVLKDKTLLEKIIISFFQSVTTRTAGFSTVEMGIIKLPTLMIILILMFIGASPGSTGGGIRTTVFYLLNKYILSFFNKKAKIEYDKNFISFQSINKALVSFIFGIFFIFFSVFLLTLTEENKNMKDLVFETVSAFATVGLSTGITPHLSNYGQIIIIITMFVGRIGLLTLGFSLVNQSKNLNYDYKEADIII